MLQIDTVKVLLLHYCLFMISVCFLASGDGTPTQMWDETEAGDDDDMDIPSHLPPKQREMFMRIRQHTMKMKREKSELFQNKNESDQKSDDRMKSKYNTVVKCHMEQKIVVVCFV